MTTAGRDYPTRVKCKFQNRDGEIVLDQIRTIDKSRLVKKMGQISEQEAEQVLIVLSEMFSQ